jgi:hypothetical protein
VGSTPNLAAGLQGLAVADQIVIAARPVDWLAMVCLSDPGEHDLKGIANPCMWRVERAAETESRRCASWPSRADPLVGRDEKWIYCAGVASAGRRGQVVVLGVNPGSARPHLSVRANERKECRRCAPVPAHHEQRFRRSRQLSGR